MLAPLAVTLLAAAGPATAGPAAHVAAIPCAGAREHADRSKRAHAVLCLVNQARAAHGLSRLQTNTPLARAARRHARDMVARDFFDHTSPGGSTPTSRARRAGYRRAAIGETIAFAIGPDATPRGAVRGWLRSAPHRRVLFDAGMRDIGVGIADGVPLAGAASGEGETVVMDVGGA